MLLQKERIWRYCSDLRQTNTKVGEYVYDAWGNCTITTNVNLIASINPFRYRGYYFDDETGFYYFNTRYYNPELGRWISPNSFKYIDLETINGVNLYCYCLDNPVSYVDPNGNSAILIGLIIGAIVGAVVGFGIAAYKDYKDDGDIFNGSVKWYEYLLSSVLGGAIGAGTGTGIGAFAATTFTIGIPMLGWINTGGALVLGISETISITVTGANILELASILGITYLFTKGKLPNNQYQNKQWAEAMRQLRITDKDLWRRLHNEIHKYPYQNSLKDLLKVLTEILIKWGKY